MSTKDDAGRYVRPTRIHVISPGASRTPKQMFTAEDAHVINGVLRMTNPAQEWDNPTTHNGDIYVWPLPGTLVVIQKAER